MRQIGWIQQLRHRGRVRFRMKLKWWLLKYIIGRLVSRLQWRLRLVVGKQQLIKRWRCFGWHQYIRCSWIWLMMIDICRFRQQRCMGRLILIQYLVKQHIWKHCPLNHHRILGFRMILNSQLIVVLRMIIRSLILVRSSNLPMNRWLRKPSMIRIVLDFWLG